MTDIKMTWDKWVERFEAHEKRFFGYRLKGETRHSTLYDLYNDGYSPIRAFELVKYSARLQKLEPISMILVVVFITGLMMTGISYFSSGEVNYTFAVCLTIGFLLYIALVKMTVKKVVSLRHSLNKSL